MEKIQLQILRLVPSYSNSNVFILMLGEVNGNRKLPIIIGEHEARSIALELEGITFIRPLTHELLKNVAESFGITLTEVLIDDFKDGIFYSKLFFTDKSAEKVIDARTSDAVAVALKYNAPIYTTIDVLNVAGAVFQESEAENTEEEKNTAQETSMEDLQQQLKEAEEKEEYEKASKIMQEIENRKKKK